MSLENKSFKLFHVSENPHIDVFHPKKSPSSTEGDIGKVVWAIDEVHLPNYLVPSDCPRVTYWAGTKTTEKDKASFLEGDFKQVIALESYWLDRVENTEIYLYEFPIEPFKVFDSNAGYYISREPIIPLGVKKLENPLLLLKEREIEVKLLPNLWQLRDEIVDSSLNFSIIRMRNAQERV